jgi:hypothetical protein
MGYGAALGGLLLLSAGAGVRQCGGCATMSNELHQNHISQIQYSYPPGVFDTKEEIIDSSLVGFH